jgi:hypothetical protein
MGQWKGPFWELKDMCSRLGPAVGQFYGIGGLIEHTF